MSYRVIATIDKTIYESDGVTPIISLVQDKEVIIQNDNLKEALMLWGWAKLYDPTKPYPPRGIGIYEIGMAYQPNKFVIHETGLYESNTVTSNSWVSSQWTLRLQGV